MFISHSGTNCVQSEMRELVQSFKVLDHASKASVGQSRAVIEPELVTFKMVWKNFSEVLKPVISNVIAPSEVDGESPESSLF